MSKASSTTALAAHHGNPSPSAITATPATTTAPPTKSSPFPFAKTFYRRNLPSPPSTSFSSAEGRKLFKESMGLGFMEGYFRLAEQFRTQDEPAFCGLSSMTMVLNALSIDPKRVWKGPWRWYNESMLDCCKDLEAIKQDGITFDEFACLSRCNGLSVKSKRPMMWKLYDLKNKSKPPVVRTQSEAMDELQAQAQENANANALQTGEAEDQIEIVGMLEGSEPSESKTSCSIEKDPEECARLEAARTAREISSRRFYTLEEFRQDVKLSCVSTDGPVVVVSYSRQEFKQTGDGHFSPIAGYHPNSDKVLIMDVARFKYPPHWVPLEALYNSMCRVDTSTMRTRGWMVLHNSDQLKSLFFTWNSPNSIAVFNESDGYNANQMYENSMAYLLDFEKKHGDKCKHCDVCTLYHNKFPNAMKALDVFGGTNDSSCDTSGASSGTIESAAAAAGGAGGNSRNSGDKDKTLASKDFCAEMCHCSQDSVDAVLFCIFNALGGVSVDQLFGNYSERFHIQLSEKHEIIRNRLVNGIKSTGIYKVVLDLYQSGRHKKMFEKMVSAAAASECSLTVEIITLMLLIVNDNVWKCLKNEKLSQELIDLTRVSDDWGELRHEINVLRYQLLYLKKMAHDYAQSRSSAEAAKLMIEKDSKMSNETIDEKRKGKAESACGCSSV